MYRAINVSNSSDIERFCSLDGLGSIDPSTLASHQPDESLLLIEETGQRAARCSLWWSNPPPLGGHRPGLIGHYAAQDDALAGPILNTACQHLASHGCTIAIGPMDGNTWRRYRLLTERGREPLFFLEPDNPDDWPAHFTANGFSPLAHYYSALNTNLEVEDPRIGQIEQRISERGIRLRPLNLQSFESELRAIFAVSLASFAENFLYTPISEEEFVAQYRGIEPYIRPELVLIAEQEGVVAGFVFAIPDLLQARRGQPVNTMIIKTLAVHPALGGGGLGSLLTARCQEAARRLGYSRSIHALMHESNKSRKISSHTATTIRRYALFARDLAKT